VAALTNIVAIVQARLGSSRLPKKVLKKLEERTVIQVLLDRLSKSEKLNAIVVAIPDTEKDIPLAEHLIQLGHDVFGGSEDDVLSRYYEAALYSSADVIVRITGDCPLVDSQLLDVMLESFLSNGYQYLSNVAPPTFPDGLDIEIFTFSALKRAHNLAKDPGEREHVTSFIRSNNNDGVGNYALNDENYSSLRWTLDNAEDLEFIRAAFKAFSPNVFFTWRELLERLRELPNIVELNSRYTRNEGKNMGSGQKLYRRAKQLIPGGTMLLSKRPEMFLPDKWPSYFSKSKGCLVWDLDGNKFVDMSIMGIGTNILGYGHPEVDEAVIGAVALGNMSTLNAPEEVYLAEKLLSMHPWAGMARFARSGGEANAIAVRIARAATGKDGVAVCGYHGWHDWYLATNLADSENLNKHLLPGLSTVGVPRNLASSVFPFDYGDIAALVKIVERGDIGTIKMEVCRSTEPNVDFLRQVRALAEKRGIVLIFDECTSGFRAAYGGLHKNIGVDPDVAMFGKALGNGYAVTAVIGKEAVMQAAQNTFISSTFWTERIGSVAALKTLEVMENERVWQKISATGCAIKARWQNLADGVGLPIVQWGLPALAGFSIDSEDNLKFKTFLTQEMLKKGFFAGNSIYVSSAHTDDVVEEYFCAVTPIFEIMADCYHGNRNIDQLLDGPVCHSGFARLN